MKAIRVHGYGQPPQLDAVPEPKASRPDDVVVKIGGAGLCRTDLHIMQLVLDDLRHGRIRGRAILSPG